jgi:AraC-like DNA-binding protein
VNFDDMIPNWRMNTFEALNHILVLVVHGRLVYTFNHERMAVEKGDLVYIPKGTMRGAENDGAHPHRKYTALFQHSFPRGEFPWFDRNRVVCRKTRHFDQIRQLFEELYREKVEEKPLHNFICVGKLQELVGLACRGVETADISPMKWKLAEEIKSYLLGHYREAVDLRALAAISGLTPNYTVSLFKEVTGQTPHQYVQQLRLAKARSLLSSTTMNVSEVAEYLGYYDTSYFYRKFKQATSLSPTEFAAHARIE